MDFDPTIGRPGTLGTSRPASAVSIEARRPVEPPEIARDTAARGSDRDAYASLGLRPGGDVARDVVLHLSQRALALAKSAAERPPQTKSVDEEADTSAPRRAPRGGGDAPAPKIDVRA